MHSLSVSLGQRAYPIHIGVGLLPQADLLLAALPIPRAAIVTNEVVAPLYLQTFAEPLRAAGVRLTEIVLPDGELHKNWQTLSRIYDTLLAEHCDRATTVIALGGSVMFTSELFCVLINS